ncbi:hypothetical protein CsSME_00051525 [Camellia sinensis var. sinensis]
MLDSALAAIEYDPRIFHQTSVRVFVSRAFLKQLDNFLSIGFHNHVVEAFLENDGQSFVYPPQFSFKAGTAAHPPIISANPSSPFITNKTRKAIWSTAPFAAISV